MTRVLCITGSGMPKAAMLGHPLLTLLINNLQIGHAQASEKHLQDADIFQLVESKTQRAITTLEAICITRA